MKHVARENGIHETDKKMINELIRIPEHPDSLKIFRCKFCPGEGRLFVGLSEETFLAHITTSHGNKVARRRPEKLVRECRICGEVSATDTELGEHVRQHTRMTPFAGFGPRGDSDRSGSESEDSRLTVAHSRRRNSRAPGSTKEIDKFVKKMRRTSDQEFSSSRRRKRAESSDDEVKVDLEASLEMVQRKRRCLEISRRETRPVRTAARSGRGEERTGRGGTGLEDGELARSPGSSGRRRVEDVRDHEGRTRSRRDEREDRADWNRNTIRNINKHLTSGYSGSGDDWRERRREETGERAARRSWEKPDDRRSREEDRDRGHHRRPREEYPARREGGRDGDFPRGGRGGGSRGGWGGSRGGRGGFSRGGRGGGFPRGGRGAGSRGGRGRGGRGGFEDRGRHQERGEDWRCGNCGFHNYPERKECHKCQNAKSEVPQPPESNAMEDTRNEIEAMMQQLQQERAAASNVVADIIQPILDHVLDHVLDQILANDLALSESEDPPPPPVSSSETPDSPVYCPPGTESEDEEMATVEVGESVSYECPECQLRQDDIYDIMMHLEQDHGFPDDEEILRKNVKEVRTKKSEMPDSTTKISVEENETNENNN